MNNTGRQGITDSGFKAQHPNQVGGDPVLEAVKKLSQELELDPQFYGRVTMIYEAGKPIRLELQRSHLLTKARTLDSGGPPA